MQEYWRLLPHTNGPADQELASGVALISGLEQTNQPALRWYGASEAALVIGSGQKLSDIDQQACAAAGISIHKRASGGTAVLFTTDVLMQDVALPTGHPLQRGDVTESYHWLGVVWQHALASLGIVATLVDVPHARNDTQNLDPLVKRACFGGISPYEVLVNGRKLVGFSQIRRRAGTLLQVGIYRRWPGHALAELLAVSPDEQATLVDRLAARVAGLDDVLPAPPSDTAVIDAFAAALRDLHGVTLQESTWTAAEQQAQQATRSRFAPVIPDA